MIGRLTGRVVAEEPDGSLVVDVGGVGYEVRAPLGTLGRATPGLDGRIELFTHLHVREDIMDLYGFASEVERRVFKLLIDVPNVGPKTALGVLSALPPVELAQAVAAKDVARLTRIDGVGKKTAERLVLELRERLQKVSDLASVQRAPTGTTANDEARLIGALTNMGYRLPDAQRAVRALGDRVGKDALADLLRDALATLAT
ncbi:MAG TPA: Holliday junction branch migration protein RuvA [Polyangiaceae bacterium]|nr:Holliday junction branch migration protein RuvA [Polyangiaceae bacterium]